MKTLACLLFAAVACFAQRPVQRATQRPAQPVTPRPEDDVNAVYKQMERAEQTGDADTWVALWTRETAANTEKMRQYIRPRPDVHYRATRILVIGDQAALLGDSGPEQFLNMRFAKQDGQWKIAAQGWSNVAPHPDMVYAMIPPAGGAFLRAGSPWPNVALALDGGAEKKYGWQMRAVHDESYLYVRLESPEPLPAPGSTVTPEAAQRVDSGVHAGWPVMRINVTSAAAPAREYILNAGANIGDQSTFDEQGKANSHHHFVAYSMRLERAEREIFGAGAGLTIDPLVSVSDRFFDLKIPLRTLGIADPDRAKIVLGDASWPKSSIVSVEARQYR